MVLRRDPDPGVGYGEAQHVQPGIGIDGMIENQGHPADRGVFDRVREQVDHDLADLLEIADDSGRDVRRHVDLGPEPLLPRVGLQVARELSHQLAWAEMHRHRRRTAILGRSVVEDVVGQHEQVLGALARDRRACLAVRLDGLDFEQPEHAHHPVERRADLMAHHREKLRLRPVCRLSLFPCTIMGLHLGYHLAGALGHCILQRVAQPLGLGCPEAQHMQCPFHPPDFVVAGLGDVAVVVSTGERGDMVRDVAQPANGPPAHSRPGNARRRHRDGEKPAEAERDPSSQPLGPNLACGGFGLHPVEQIVGERDQGLGLCLHTFQRGIEVIRGREASGLGSIGADRAEFGGETVEQGSGPGAGASRGKIGDPVSGVREVFGHRFARGRERLRCVNLVDLQ